MSDPANLVGGAGIGLGTDTRAIQWYPRFGMRRWIASTVLAIVGCAEQTEDACKDGEQTRARDGCNVCNCSNGVWGWTEKACSYGVPPEQDTVCYSLGLADVEPDAPGLQIECNVLAEIERSGRTEVSPTPLCVSTPDGYTWPAADVDACWFPRTDATRTGDPLDDISSECIESRGEQPVAELELMRRPETDAVGASFAIVCTHPEPLCPGEPEL